MTKLRDKLIDAVLIKGNVPIIMQEQPNTAVRLVLELDSQTYFHADGFAKVKWPDKWDEEFGYDLACQRAAAKIVKNVMRQPELARLLLEELENVPE